MKWEIRTLYNSVSNKGLWIVQIFKLFDKYLTEREQIYNENRIVVTYAFK
jgi:hypothetical protein